MYDNKNKVQPEPWLWENAANEKENKGMKRNWKGILCLILAVAMVFNMDTSVFAAAETDSATETAVSAEAAAATEEAAAEPVSETAETEMISPDEAGTVSQENAGAAGITSGTTVSGLTLSFGSDITAAYTADSVISLTKASGTTAVVTVAGSAPNDTLTINAGEGVVMKFTDLTSGQVGSSGKILTINGGTAEFSKTVTSPIFFGSTGTVVSGNGGNAVVSSNSVYYGISTAVNGATLNNEYATIYQASPRNYSSADYSTGIITVLSGNRGFYYIKKTNTMEYISGVYNYPYYNFELNASDLTYGKAAFYRFGSSSVWYYFDVPELANNSTTYINDYTLSMDGLNLGKTYAEPEGTYYYTLVSDTYFSNNHNKVYYTDANKAYWTASTNMIKFLDGSSEFEYGEYYYLYSVKYEAGKFLDYNNIISQLEYTDKIDASDSTTFSLAAGDYKLMYGEYLYNDKSHAVKATFKGKNVTSIVDTEFYLQDQIENGILKPGAAAIGDSEMPAVSANTTVYARSEYTDGNNKTISSNLLPLTVAKRPVELTIKNPDNYPCSRRGADTVKTVSNSYISAVVCDSLVDSSTMHYYGYNNSVLSTETADLGTAGKVLKSGTDAAIAGFAYGFDANVPKTYTIYLNGTIADEFANNYEIKYGEDNVTETYNGSSSIYSKSYSSSHYKVTSGYYYTYILQYYDYSTKNGKKTGREIRKASSCEASDLSHINADTDGVLSDFQNTLSANTSSAKISGWNVYYKDINGTYTRFNNTAYNPQDTINASNARGDLYIFAAVTAYASESGTSASVNISTITPVTYDGYPFVLPSENEKVRNDVLDLLITNDGEELKLGTDYTVKYKNNKNASVYFDNSVSGENAAHKIYDDPDKWPQVIITGKGDYKTLKATVYFDIYPVNIAAYSGTNGGYSYSFSRTGFDSFYFYTSRKGIKYSYKIAYSTSYLNNNKNNIIRSYTLKKGSTDAKKALKDYTETLMVQDATTKTWSDAGLPKNVRTAGTYMIRLTGHGNFTGTYNSADFMVYENNRFEDNKVKIKNRSIEYKNSVNIADFGITVYDKKTKKALSADTYNMSYSSINPVTLTVPDQPAGVLYIYISAKDGFESTYGYGYKLVTVYLDGLKIKASDFELSWNTAPYNADYQLQGVKFKDPSKVSANDVKIYTDSEIRVYNSKYLGYSTITAMNPGTYTVWIAGKGKYYRRDYWVKLKYKITPLKLSEAMTAGKLKMSAGDREVNINGTTTAITVSENFDNGTAGTVSRTYHNDYIDQDNGNYSYNKIIYRGDTGCFNVTSWGLNKKAGDTTVKVKALADSGYTGTATLTFKLKPKEINSLGTEFAGENSVFAVVDDTISKNNGKVKVSCKLYQVAEDGKLKGSSVLKEGRDYSAAVVLSGNGVSNNEIRIKTADGTPNFKFRDNICVTFDMYSAKAKKPAITLSQNEFRYTGDACTPGMVVTFNGKEYVVDGPNDSKWDSTAYYLTKGKNKDYYCAYSNDGTVEAKYSRCREVGTAKVEIILHRTDDSGEYPAGGVIATTTYKIRPQKSNNVILTR